MQLVTLGWWQWDRTGDTEMELGVLGWNWDYWDTTGNTGMGTLGQDGGHWDGTGDTGMVTLVWGQWGSGTGMELGMLGWWH